MALYLIDPCRTVIANLPPYSNVQQIKVDNPASSILSVLDKLEADRKAEIARKAAEAVRIAQEAAERARIAAVWAEHPPGNNYYVGQCVWWVAVWTNVPAGLGNADTWYLRAAAWGFNVGSEPRVGAVGVSTRGRWGHVVLVLSVNGDGTITIREGNYDYRGSVRTRQALATDFEYVYFS